MCCSLIHCRLDNLPAARDRRAENVLDAVHSHLTVLAAVVTWLPLLAAPVPWILMPADSTSSYILLSHEATIISMSAYPLTLPVCFYHPISTAVQSLLHRAAQGIRLIYSQNGRQSHLEFMFSMHTFPVPPARHYVCSAADNLAVSHVMRPAFQLSPRLSIARRMRCDGCMTACAGKIRGDPDRVKVKVTTPLRA